VVRGGPGLGTIQPSQADYFQSVKGGGHGDYRLIVLAPASVQEMSDFVEDALELAFKYRNPSLILSDGLIGQMMEKVILRPQKPRMTEKEIEQKYGAWATIGKKADRERNIITSLELKSERQEKHNDKLQAKYREIQKNEVRYEKINCENADYLMVAYGSSARICQKAIQLGKAKGLNIGLIRPITLWPFPSEVISQAADKVKGILSVELNAGQMVEDVRLAVNGKIKVEHYGRYGGMIHSPEEVLAALEQKIIGGK
jgi:2-oxoglutarate ferredoxin oxidoreductase subunit alpha